MSAPAVPHSAQDHVRMARALFLASWSFNGCDPNPRVGCVIETGGEIVAEAWHRRAGDAHAEILALAQAGERARSATVFVTLEPCCHTGRTGPCTDALIAAGVSRVVVAMNDPNPRVAGGGLSALRQAGIAVSSGLLARQAEQLNRGFVSRMRRGRPFVCSKIAASQDGRTALASGKSVWITSKGSRADVQQLRARASAILTGARTVATDDPLMTVRIAPDERWQPPLRVILDPTLRTSPDAKILNGDASTLIITSNAASTSRASALCDAGARIERVVESGGALDLQAVLDNLATREINELMVEAGPTLNGALLQAGLLDEVVLYQAAHTLGPQGIPMFGADNSLSVIERSEFRLLATRRIGDDIRMRFASEAYPAVENPDNQ